LFLANSIELVFASLHWNTPPFDDGEAKFNGLAKDDGQDWRPKNKIFTTVSPPGAKLDGMKKNKRRNSAAQKRAFAQSATEDGRA
jgi:hypothetical protein